MLELIKNAIALTVFTSFAAWAIVTFRRNKLHRISSLPVVGPFGIIFSKDENVEFRRLRDLHGDNFIVDFFVFTYVAISNPETIKKVLKEEEGIPKMIFPIPKVMHEFQKNQIVDSNGEDYERHRSIAKNSFDLPSYKNYFTSFLDNSNKLVEHLNSKLENEIDISPIMYEATLDILGETLLGYKFDSLSGKESSKKHVESYNSYMTHMFDPLWVMLPFLEKLPLPRTNRLKESVNGMRNLLDQMISEKLDKRKKGIRPEYPCLLDHAIDIVYTPDAVLSEQELKADLFSFFVAGHETTASAVIWGLKLLADHPTIQDEVYEEIDSVLKGRDPTFEDLEKMHYLKRTMKEVMRIQPPVHQLPGRGTLKDVPIDEIVIPANSTVSIMVNLAHYNKDWRDPETFDPDRFLPENSRGRHSHSYIPFSVGKRMCLGAQFSQIEQQVLYIKLLQNFTFSPGKTPIMKKRGILNNPVTAHLNLSKR